MRVHVSSYLELLMTYSLVSVTDTCQQSLPLQHGTTLYGHAREWKNYVLFQLPDWCLRIQAQLVEISCGHATVNSQDVGSYFIIFTEAMLNISQSTCSQDRTNLYKNDFIQSVYDTSKYWTTLSNFLQSSCAVFSMKSNYRQHNGMYKQIFQRVLDEGLTMVILHLVKHFKTLFPACFGICSFTC